MSNYSKSFKRIICSLVLVVALILGGCGNPATTRTSAASLSSSEGGSEKSVHGEAWKTYNVIGNLPETVPDVKDDMYTHYNYMYISENQGAAIIRTIAHSYEFMDKVLALIKEGNISGNGFKQLKIFYDMVEDRDTLIKIGMSEIRPYLERIESAGSIEDLNKLLSSSDFPFTPFIDTILSSSDTRKGNIICVRPSLVSVSYKYHGVNPFQETDNEDQRLANESIQEILLNNLQSIFKDAEYNKADTDRLSHEILEFEMSYTGKLESMEKEYMKEHGKLPECYSGISEEEMYKLCPDFPLEGLLAKQGRTGLDSYMVDLFGWLESLNKVWNQNNLEALKDIIKAYVIVETDPYRYRLSETLGEGKVNPYTSYYACNNRYTFDHLISSIYVDKYIGDDVISHMEAIGKKYIKEYKALINDTPWLLADAKSAAILKLDKLTLNILKPERGYIDYDGLTLIPASKGGTLLSNYFILKDYRIEQENKLIGKTGKDTDWYNFEPSFNNCTSCSREDAINVYPGYVTSLLYEKDMSDEELLAGLGNVIGHEISHIFDVEGYKYDAYGVFNPIFFEIDLKEYNKRIEKLVTYYGSIKYLSDLGADPEKYKVEGVADILGLQATFDILREYKDPDYEKFFAKFFGIYATVWENDDEVKNATLTDSHPPYHIRNNIMVQMDDTIYDLFGIKEGDGMYLAPEERIYIFGPKS